MVLQLDTTAVATRHIEAWNRHDPEGIVASLSLETTLVDPLCPNGVGGPALVDYVSGLFVAFPDLAIEAVNVRVTEGEPATVAVEWLMRGTNTGTCWATRQPAEGSPSRGPPS